MLFANPALQVQLMLEMLIVVLATYPPLCLFLFITQSFFSAYPPDFAVVLPREVLDSLDPAV